MASTILFAKPDHFEAIPLLDMNRLSLFEHIHKLPIKENLSLRPRILQNLDINLYILAHDHRPKTKRERVDPDQHHALSAVVDDGPPAVERVGG
jgi:hypothetical protein